MQAAMSPEELKKRAEYYTALLLTGQNSRGKDYRKIKRVYQIFFLNFEPFPKSNKVPRRYFYQEEEEHDRLSEATEIIMYELPKMEKVVNKYLSGKVDITNLAVEEKWCIYMKYRHDARAEALIKQLCHEEEGIMRAEQSVVKVSRDYIRFARKMAEMKNNFDREQELERIHKIGHAEGKAEEHEKAYREKLETARKMKTRGKYSIEEIAEDTGLSLEEINKL